MLGMVFTELVEMVEETFSPEIADAVLRDVAPENGGAYTSVGYYDHNELVALVVALSQRTGVPVPTLVQAFGKHMLGRFTALFPQMFERHTHFFDFVASIDGQIHVEVRKLYANARLPRFQVLSRSDDELRLLYQSSRDMQPLAIGLLEGAAAHYGFVCRIDTEAADAAAADAGPSGTVFRIQRVG
jgi:hypothetical protein